MVELIVGGCSSGKSEYAEQRILTLPDRIPRYYIATMASNDAESRKRIRKHRIRRQNMGFITIEQPLRIEEALDEMKSGRKIILLECITSLTANEMFGSGTDKPVEPFDAARRICGGLLRMISPETDLFLVSDNVFEDGAVYDILTENYRTALGLVNCRMAAAADMVTETAAGIPVRIKSAPAETAGRPAEKTEGRPAEEPAGKLIKETDMTLIIGGRHQGKTEYAHSRYAGHPLLDHLQTQVREDLQQGKTGEEILDGLLDFAEKTPGCVIVCDEVGNGIVPIDAFERKYRDVLGEILMQLSVRSSEVIRVFCGIGQVLKRQE